MTDAFWNAEELMGNSAEVIDFFTITVVKQYSYWQHWWETSIMLNSLAACQSLFNHFSIKREFTLNLHHMVTWLPSTCVGKAMQIKGGMGWSKSTWQCRRDMSVITMFNRCKYMSGLTAMGAITIILIII